MEVITTESAYKEHNKRLTDQVAELRDELEGAVERALCAEALSRRRGERIEELTDILDACEAANAKHLSRIDHLEAMYWKQFCQREKLKQLLRDVWKWASNPHDLTEGKALHDRMEQLGLLDGEQND